MMCGLEENGADIYRRCAQLIWNDFCLLFAALDENPDKTERDECWNDFYYRFWKGKTDGICIMDRIIGAYMDGPISVSAQSPFCESMLRSCLKEVIEEKGMADFRVVLRKVKDELLHLCSTGIADMVWEKSFPGNRCADAAGIDDGIYQEAMCRLCRMYLGRLSSMEVRTMWLVAAADGYACAADIADEEGMSAALGRSLFKELEKDRIRKASCR